MEAKSKGHVAFVRTSGHGDYEYYVQKGEVYRAPVTNAMDLDGYRMGRWEGPLRQLKTIIQQQVDAAAKFGGSVEIDKKYQKQLGEAAMPKSMPRHRSVNQRSVVKVRSTGGGKYSYAFQGPRAGQWDELDDLPMQEVFRKVLAILGRHPKTVIILPKYTLGPLTRAVPTGEPPFVIYMDPGGHEVMTGYSAKELWADYGKKLIAGEKLTPPESGRPAPGWEDKDMDLGSLLDGLRESVGDDLGRDPQTKASKLAGGHTRTGAGNGYSVYSAAQQLLRGEGLSEDVLDESKLVGRKVKSHWGEKGEIVKVEPHSTGLTDTLVKISKSPYKKAGTEVWYAITDLRADDGGKPLPTSRKGLQSESMELLGELAGTGDVSISKLIQQLKSAGAKPFASPKSEGFWTFELKVPEGKEAAVKKLLGIIQRWAMANGYKERMDGDPMHDVGVVSHIEYVNSEKDAGISVTPYSPSYNKGIGGKGEWDVTVAIFPPGSGFQKKYRKPHRAALLGKPSGRFAGESTGLLGDLLSEMKGLSEAEVPKKGQVVEVGSGRDKHYLEVIRSYPTKDDAKGPLPTALVRLIPRNGGAAVAQRMKRSDSKIGQFSVELLDAMGQTKSSVPRYYVVFFQSSGYMDGQPVALKPAQYKRAMSYNESANTVGDLLSEGRDFPTFKKGGEVECFKCGNKWKPQLKDSGYPKGDGKYEAKCPKCGLLTFYDLTEAVRALGLHGLLEDLRPQVDLDEAKGVPATVENFILVLSSKLTQYDQRLSKGEMKRGGMPNIYRLGHFMGAVGRVRDSMKGLEQSSDKAALEKLKANLNHYFTDFPPRKAVLKQIDQYLESGKLPSLVRK